MKLSLSFVCDENFGSGIFADKTHVSPSLISSPEIVSLFFFKQVMSLLHIYL